MPQTFRKFAVMLTSLYFPALIGDFKADPLVVPEIFAPAFHALHCRVAVVALLAAAAQIRGPALADVAYCHKYFLHARGFFFIPLSSTRQ